MRTASARHEGWGATSERGTLALDKLELLILARLSVAGQRPPSDAQISRSLQPLFARRLTLNEWRESYARALASLREQQQVAPARLSLQPAGRARLKRALRLATAPRAKDWASFRRRYLPHLLFDGARPRDRIDPRVCVLAERLQVPISARSSIESVLGAWLKRQLGIEGEPTLESVGLALLGRELDLRTQQRPRALLRQILVLLSGATKDSADAVLDARIASWVFPSPTPIGRARAGQAVPAPSPRGADGAGGRAVEPPASSGDDGGDQSGDQRGAAAPAQVGPRRTKPAKVGSARDAQALDDAFVQRAARKIEHAARAPGARRYGPDKVFIASVWESLARDPELCPLGEAGFKNLLVEAHRRGLVDLSRADLVAAMDPRDVAASETRHLSATYHFIARGASA